MGNKKALIAMSGGVDSSVAAQLLLDAGYDCIGATMRLYDAGTPGRDPARACGNLADIADARAVANRPGLPLCRTRPDIFLIPLPLNTSASAMSPAKP